MALKYGIPPGNPTVVWDDIEGVPGTVTNDPYVSWRYHLDRTGGERGGVDMTAANGTPVYAPIDCRVQHYSGGAGIAVRMWAADSSGWSDVFDHLSSIAVPDGANVPFGGLVGYSGGTYGYAPHLHWHRLDPSGIRRIPWDYFTDGTTTTIEENDVVIYEATSSSSDGLIAKGQFFIQGAAGPLRWLSALEKGSYDYWANNGIPYRRAPWSGNDIRQLVTMVGLYNLGAQSSMNGQLLIGSNPLKTVGTAY